MGNRLTVPAIAYLNPSDPYQKYTKKQKPTPQFLSHLSRITHPTGATEADFIALRYSSNEIADDTMIDWKKSLEYVIGWLKKNEAML